ncbi:hypothetical protein ISN44_As02g014770 [Arabidopsis suecica]|nr:hypothetical protein ISN44_As02g014770 [Arabidopsis suecica]
MAKWSAILVILMVVIAALAVEAKWSEKDFIQCFRKCSKNCKKHDGDCFEKCKIKCGGPNPPHSSSRRSSHGMDYVEVRGSRK